jgi:hypothetical protein
MKFFKSSIVTPFIKKSGQGWNYKENTGCTKEKYDNQPSFYLQGRQTKIIVLYLKWPIFNSGNAGWVTVSRLFLSTIMTGGKS